MGAKMCWICGAGDFTPRLLAPRPGDLVLAADGGLEPLRRMGILPDHIVGDFDSLGYCPAGGNVDVYPPEKDDTDLLLAVKYGLSRGAEHFLIYGGLGGRLSHTMANIQVLRYLRSCGCHGALIGEDSVVTVFSEETVSFRPGCTGMLSLFALGGAAEGVTLRGLKYNVEHVTLTADYPLGVSNEFTGQSAQVTVQKGALLAVWESGRSRFEKLSFAGAEGSMV